MCLIRWRSLTTITATAIRGDSFSVTRVRELGVRLGAQLQFWAVLFMFALVAVVSCWVRSKAKLKERNLGLE